MRKIKFRAWHKKEMVPVGEIELFTNDTYNINDGIPISNENLMQFTGLTDKDDKEIYEGDIVQGTLEDDKPEVVEFVDGGFWLIREGGMHFMPSKNLRKVIGNIYEHPELLASNEK